MPPSSGKSAINVQARTGPTPGIDVSSRYRCASVASVATLSTRRLSSSSMSAASLAIRRRERRCKIRSSSSLEAFSAAYELLRCRRRPLRWTRWHDADERGDHSGVERIVLGQNPPRLGELPQLERIDLAHGNAGCLQ